jgi:cytochrome b pre-mRNA-processing protein 3
MRRIGEAFYGRQAAYGVALAAPHNEDLAALLGRNVFAGAARDGAGRLAAYSRQALRQLAAQDGFERGEISFPDPDQVLLHG